MKLVPAWGLFPSQEWPFPEGVLLGSAVLAAWEATKLLTAWELLPSWEKPSLEGILLWQTMLASWEAMLSQGRGVACLPAYLRRSYAVTCLGIASLLGRVFPWKSAIEGLHWLPGKSYCPGELPACLPVINYWLPKLYFLPFCILSYWTYLVACF